MAGVLDRRSRWGVPGGVPGARVPIGLLAAGLVLSGCGDAHTPDLDAITGGADVESEALGPDDRDVAQDAARDALPGLTDVAGGSDGIVPATPDALDAEAPAALLTLVSVEPDRGDSDRPGTVTLMGTGFDDSLEVRFGGRPSPYVFVLGPNVANCTVPAGPPGVVDVVVRRGDGTAATLVAAFTYQRALSLRAVEPAHGSAGGGTPILIRGAGFLDAPQFLLGGRQVVSAQVVDDQTVLALTPPHAPGPVALYALTGEEQVVLREAFVFDDEGIRPSIPGLSVLSVSPASGPSRGGSEVRVLGSGFAPGASVRFGGIPAVGVTFVSEAELRVRTPEGSPGPVDVVVRVSVGEALLRNGYEFKAPGMAVLAVEPDSGAHGGGTRVRLFGQGLDGVERVFFGGVQSPEITVESSVSVVAVAPRAEQTGPVMVMALGNGGAFRDRAFRYYDPMLRGGGTWGPAIRGDVNVTVLSSQTGRGLPGAYVSLGADPHTPHQGVTDSRGQITFAADDLRGPVAVHATALAHTAVSLAGFDARNATVYVGTVVSPESPTNPPGGTTGTSCTVSGRILDYGKYLIKPPWADGTPFGQCWTSSQTMFGGNPDPGPGAYVDGSGRFRLATRRGQFGVVCAMMVMPPSGGQAFMVRMGMVPRVICRDTPVDGVDVALDVETDADLWLAVRGLPDHALGINGPALLGGWHLGDDGYLDLLRRYERVGADRLKVAWQPRAFQDPIAGNGYSVYQSVSARSSNGMPYAVTLSAGVQPPSSWPVLVVGDSEPMPMATQIPRAVTAMASLPDGALVADDGGATYWFDGMDFHVGPMRTGLPIRGLWGVSADDFWAVGDRGRVWRIQDRVVHEVATGVAVDLTGISGVVGPDGEPELSIAGGPYLLRYDSGGFAIETLPSATQVRAVRRYADGSVVAVGVGGALVVGRAGQAFDVTRPTPQDLVALDGPGVEDIWAVGREGALIRMTGDELTVWQIPGGGEVSGIVRRGDCDVLVFGKDGLVVGFDCVSFTDRSRRDVSLDLLAGGAFGGEVLLAGRHFAALPAFLGFPLVLEPVENQSWSRRRVAWSLSGEQEPSYQQLLLSGPTGYTFWVITAGGSVRDVELPDFPRVFGYDPVPGGAMRMNLTCSRSPGFDINAFTSTDTGYYRQESFSVALASFQ